MKHTTKEAFFLLFFLLLLSNKAHAYLDPGSGSMLLQLALGGIAGAIVLGKLLFKNFFRGIGSFFRDKRKKNGQ